MKELTNILTINETVEPLFPRGSGADPIVVLGDCGFAKDTSKVYFFGSYLEAKQDHATNPDAIGPVPDDWSDNPVLKEVRDIFAEGAIRNMGQIGVNQVYVVNMGSAPGALDYTAAFNTINSLPVKVEDYVGLYDVARLASIGERMNTLENAGNYRNAVGTVNPTATKAEMLLITDEAQGELTEPLPFVQNSRVHIHTDPDMQGTYTAKIACTPYWQDPGFGTYRSKTVEDIKVWDTIDREDLMNAGLVVDAPNLVDPSLAEPFMAVSTAYKEVGGERPTDSLLHLRRNVDEQWRQTDIITLRMVKMNNTAVAKGLIENVANAYLQTQVDAGYIIPKKTVPTDNGYLFELSYDSLDPFKLNRVRKVRPVGSVHTIEDTSAIQVPIGGG